MTINENDGAPSAASASAHSKAPDEAGLLTDMATVSHDQDATHSPTRFSTSLERGLRIMGLFTESRPTWRLADVAAELGYSRPTTHRYLTTLVTLGQLVRTDARGYRHPQFPQPADAYGSARP